MAIYTHLAHRRTCWLVLIIDCCKLLNLLLFRSRGQLGLETLDSEDQPKLLDALAGVKVGSAF